MKIRIRFANTSYACIHGFAMSCKKYAALLDYRDELKQAAIWSKE
jgi:hypothetical protein